MLPLLRDSDMVIIQIIAFIMSHDCKKKDNLARSQKKKKKLLFLWFNVLVENICFRHFWTEPRLPVMYVYPLKPTFI